MNTNCVSTNEKDNYNVSTSEDKNVKYLSCTEYIDNNQVDNNQINDNQINDSENNDSENNDSENNDSENDDSENDESDSEDEMLLSVNFSVKDDSEMFVLSINGVPNFYTKNLKDARTLMWDYAKSRRIQETQYNTYIRACPDKNRIEIVGTHKFSIFFVDRVICRLLVSSIRELEQCKNDTIKTPTMPKTQTPPKIPSPQKSGFFSSFFW
jgi:inosine/xanthosine triphosphate pyrophosphatase family protein